MDTQIQNLIDQATKESKGITILNTAEQLEEFYRENIKNYSVWRAVASIEDWLPVDQKFLQDFRKQLNDNNVDTRVIFKESGLKYEQEKMKNRHIKTIPDTYTFRSSIDILDDKILVMNPHQTILGIVIENATLVDIFIGMFDVMWELLPERD